MRKALSTGLSPDARLRVALDHLIESGHGLISHAALVAIIRRFTKGDRRRALLEAIGTAQEVCIENIKLRQWGIQWLVRKTWDLAEAIKRCEAMRRKVEPLAVDGKLDLNDEAVWQGLWNAWQDDWTRTITSVSDWQDLWDPADLPMEPYNRAKACRILRQLQEFLGPRPSLTNELCFWFADVAEALPQKGSMKRHD
jgi:hypothetical protein